MHKICLKKGNFVSKMGENKKGSLANSFEKQFAIGQVIHSAKKFGELLCQSDSQLPQKWFEIGDKIPPISGSVFYIGPI